jgi:hypothetical protein
MSSDVSDIAEGVTKGILSFSEEKIKELVRNFRNKKLVFIEDPQTIEVVKEQYRSGENKFYEIYIKDKELLFLVRLGLTLRKIENDQERSQNLRSKIFVKYKVEGLHVAEFVQNGVLNRYVGILIDELDSVEKLEKEIYEILKGN